MTLEGCQSNLGLILRSRQTLFPLLMAGTETMVLVLGFCLSTFFSANFQGKCCLSLGKSWLIPSFSLRTMSEYCSARASRVGLSTKQATEPYSDNFLNCTRNPWEPYLDKEIPIRRAPRWLLCSLGSHLGVHFSKKNLRR